MNSIIDEIIQQAESAQRITHKQHINTRTQKGENALLHYLAKNIGTDNSVVLPVVKRLVDAGSSLVSSDHNGRTPFILLLNRMDCIHNDGSEAIIDILRKNKSRFPRNATSPYLIIYIRMKKCGALQRHSHPIRRILSLMTEKNMFEKDDWNTLVRRMNEALKTGVYDYVVDIIHSTNQFGRSFRNGLTTLLTTAIDARSDPKMITFLLQRGAIPTISHLHKAANRGDVRLFKELVDFVKDFDRDEFLSDFAMLAMDRIGKEEGYTDIFNWLIENGARSDEMLMHRLILRNKKNIIEALYRHGSRLFVPPDHAPRNHAYHFVRRQLDRLHIIDAMATKQLTVRKKKKDMWHHVAQQSSKMAPDLARQLRKYMN